MAVTVNGGAPSAPQIAEFKTTFDLLGLSTAALSVKANATNATAAATDVAAGTDGHVLRRSGTTLGFGTLATAAYGDATITDAKFTNRTALSVWGRSANSAGVGGDMAAATDGHVMRRSGTALGFGTLAAGAFASNTVPLTAVANITAQSVLVNATGSAAAPTALAVAASQLVGRGSTGNVAPITLGSGLTMTGTTLSSSGGAGVTDGDKGDIVVSASGATWLLDSAVVTTAAKTVLDDTTVAAMVDTLGGAASTGTGGIARAASPAFTGTPTAPTAAVSTNTTQVATTAFVRGEISNISGTITTAKTSFVNADKVLALDSASSDAPVTITGAVIRTVPVGTSLGTTGSVALDFATLVGTRQSITATGNITFTTSNLAAGRGLELRIGAGGSTRTLTWPAWVAFGAALPTSLASGATLIVSLFANSTTDASVDAVAVVSA